MCVSSSHILGDIRQQQKLAMCDSRDFVRSKTKYIDITVVMKVSYFGNVNSIFRFLRTICENTPSVLKQ